MNIKISCQHLGHLPDHEPAVSSERLMSMKFSDGSTVLDSVLEYCHKRGCVPLIEDELDAAELAEMRKNYYEVMVDLAVGVAAADDSKGTRRHT